MKSIGLTEKPLLLLVTRKSMNNIQDKIEIVTDPARLRPIDSDL